MKSLLLPYDSALEITVPRQFKLWDLVNPLFVTWYFYICNATKLLSHVVIAGRPAPRLGQAAGKALGTSRNYCTRRIPVKMLARTTDAF